MIRPFIPCLFICVVLMPDAVRAQDSGTIFYDRHWRECAEDTAYFRRTFERLDDTSFAIEDYYAWGVLQMSATTIGGYRYGAVKTGEVRFYHETGALKSVVMFVRGEEEGEFQRWYANGKLAEKGQYGAGRRVGIFTTWYSDGNLESEGGFRNDEKHGPWTFYHPNGAIRSKGIYDRDVESGKWEWFYEDGEPEGIGEYDPISARGERTWYDRTGRVCAVEKLLESRIVDGTYTAEDGSASTDVKAAYRKPLPHGVRDAADVDEYFAEHAVYPGKADGRPAMVVISAVIDREGAVVDTHLEMSTSAVFDAAARKAVVETRWQPALRHGIPAMDWVVVPILFKRD